MRIALVVQQGADHLKLVVIHELSLIHKDHIGDCQQGACHYQPQPGQCWNWFIGYRDPIASDPQVALNASILPANLTSLLPAAWNPNVVIGGALIVLALMLR